MSTTPEPRNEPSEDEVWADLVSRLEEDSDRALLSPSDAEAQDSGVPGAEPATEPPAPGAKNPHGSVDKSSADNGFDRFDPLNVRGNGAAASATPPAGNPPATNPPASGAMAGPRDYSPPEDESDSEFVPAEPASLSTVEPAIALGWIGAAGAPLGLLLASMFWRGLPWFAITGLVLIFVGSVGYLIYRLPGHRDHDDDGAQV